VRAGFGPFLGLYPHDYVRETAVLGYRTEIVLNRIIFIAVSIGVLALVVPRVAPTLLSFATEPRAVDEVVAAPPAARPAPVVQVESVDDREQRPVGRPSGRSIALRADDRGHFQVDATVNGRSIPVMVDTGATTVALNSESARRIGIFPARRDYSVPISTANGTVYAAPVTLAEVRLGRISVRNVKAVVLPGQVLGVNLLGMTFLSRLSKFEIAGDQLVLRQ